MGSIFSTNNVQQQPTQYTVTSGPQTITVTDGQPLQSASHHPNTNNDSNIQQNRDYFNSISNNPDFVEIHNIPISLYSNSSTIDDQTTVSIVRIPVNTYLATSSNATNATTAPTETIEDLINRMDNDTRLTREYAYEMPMIAVGEFGDGIMSNIRHIQRTENLDLYTINRIISSITSLGLTYMSLLGSRYPNNVYSINEDTTSLANDVPSTTTTTTTTSTTTNRIIDRLSEIYSRRIDARTNTIDPQPTTITPPTNTTVNTDTPNTTTPRTTTPIRFSLSGGSVITRENGQYQVNPINLNGNTGDGIGTTYQTFEGTDIGSIITRLITQVMNASDPQPIGITEQEITENTQTMDSDVHIETHTDETPDNQRMCTICQDEYQDGQIIRRLNNCTHLYHKSCIDTWLTDHRTCPQCRTNVVRGNTTASTASTANTSDIADTADTASNADTANTNTDVNTLVHFDELATNAINIGINSYDNSTTDTDSTEN